MTMNGFRLETEAIKFLAIREGVNLSSRKWRGDNLQFFIKEAGEFMKGDCQS